MTTTTLAASGDGSGTVTFVLLFVLALYFLPTLVALLRHSPDRGSVVVVNLFLGWTLIGWVSALAIASRSRLEPLVVVHQQAPQPMVGPPAGWYGDPSGTPGIERFWDGAAWWAQTRSAGTPLDRR